MESNVQTAGGGHGVRVIAVAAVGAGLTIIAERLLRGMRAIDLERKSALITGGARGLGFLLAREFGRRGCRVAIGARDEAELARARAGFISTDQSGPPRT